MKISKFFFVLFAVLCFCKTGFADPVSIDEIVKRLNKGNPQKYVYKNRAKIQVLVEFGVASWYECPLKPEKVNYPLLNIQDRIYQVAHKTLPFGTLIKVINPANHKKIFARVIDRGPYISGRIIDLDQPGAKALGISGIGKIILKIFKPTSVSEPTGQNTKHKKHRKR